MAYSAVLCAAAEAAKARAAVAQLQGELKSLRATAQSETLSAPLLSSAPAAAPTAAAAAPVL